MALSIGNRTQDVSTPAATTRSFSHTHNVGADGHLFFKLGMAAVVDVNDVTYNGVSLTKVSDNTVGTYSAYWEIWHLDSPATGSNILEVTFSSAQWNPVSIEVISATGCSGIGNITFDDTATSPNASTLVISQNSAVVGGIYAGNQTALNIEIDGVSRTLDYTHSVSNVTAGAIATGLSAGTINNQVSNVTNVAGLFYEILEATAAGGASGSWMMIL